MAEASEVGALLLDLIRMISNARQNSCLSERRAQASSSYVFKRKQMQHRLEKKLRIATYLIPELLSYLDASFPMEISVKYIL